MSGAHTQLSEPPPEIISKITYAPNSSTRLLVSSWDRHLYLYDTSTPTGSLIRKYKHRAPVLDVCYGESEDEAFTVGLDWDVRRVNLKTGEQTVLSTHTKPSNKVVYDNVTKTLISTSWDSTMHVHHPYATDPPKQPATVPLPAKPMAIALSPTKLVVAMTERKLFVWDMAGLATLTAQSSGPAPNIVAVEPFQRRESALRFLIRAVACMPNDAGFASSSIEGRVAVEWFDPSKEAQAKNYAFKSHRLAATDPATGEEIDEIYPVHALAFNPVHGTFVTCGGDGIINSWDTYAKRRIKGYQRYDASIPSVAFSPDGTKLAVAISPGFADGDEDNDDPTDPTKVQIWIRELTESEMKPRGK